MRKKFKKVTLETIGGGAALELFEHKLQEALANIDDQNTAATAKRKVILEITLTPDRERESAEVAIGCSTKLAPITPAQAKMHFGREEGRHCGFEAEHEVAPDNVTAIGE